MNPSSSSTAAAAVGVTVGLAVVALFKRPLWAGLILGAAGTVLTKVAIDKSAGA